MSEREKKGKTLIFVIVGGILVITIAIIIGFSKLAGSVSSQVGDVKAEVEKENQDFRFELRNEVGGSYFDLEEKINSFKKEVEELNFSKNQHDTIFSVVLEKLEKIEKEQASLYRKMNRKILALEKELGKNNQEEVVEKPIVPDVSEHFFEEVSVEDSNSKNLPVKKAPTASPWWPKRFYKKDR